MYKYELIHFWSTQKLQKFWLQDIPLFPSHLFTLETNLRYQPQRCIEALSEHTYRWSMISVTRLGDFWNFLVTNYVTKVTRLFSDFMGSLKKHCFLLKKLYADINVSAEYSLRNPGLSTLKN